MLIVSIVQMLVRRQKKKRGLIASSTLPDSFEDNHYRIYESKSKSNDVRVDIFTLAAFFNNTQFVRKQKWKANISYLFVFCLCYVIGLLFYVHYYYFSNSSRYFIIFSRMGKRSTEIASQTKSSSTL